MKRFADRNSGKETKFVWGVEGLIQISSDPEVDLVVAGIVGAAGLHPTYSAVQAGKTVGNGQQRTTGDGRRVVCTNS